MDRNQLIILLVVVAVMVPILSSAFWVEASTNSPPTNMRCCFTVVATRSSRAVELLYQALGFPLYGGNDLV